MSDEHKEPVGSPPEATESGSSAPPTDGEYRHSVDMRFAVPRWLGNFYWDLRLGRNSRKAKRPHLLPRRVRRMNRVLILFAVQMAIGWGFAVWLGFYWATQTACGGTGVIGTPTVTTESTTPGTTRTTDTTATTPTTSSVDADQVAEDIVRLINDHRTSKGLGELTGAADLDTVAENYSQWMAEDNFFDHTDPDGNTPFKRIREAGILYQAAGENLAMYRDVSDPAAAMVQNWLNSPTHRDNIEKASYEETGVGVAVSGDGIVLATQLFLKR